MKTRALLFVCIIVAVGLFCLPHSSSAYWQQRFQEYGVGEFDTMEVYMLSGEDYFDCLAFNDFSDPSWAVSSYDSGSATTHAVASGNTSTYLSFDIGFAGDRSNSLGFDFLAWHGSELKEAAYVAWTGRCWNITQSNNSYSPPGSSEAPVPEPATMLLLGSGLIGLAGFGRRKFKK
jgi:hypothetical protein